MILLREDVLNRIDGYNVIRCINKNCYCDIDFTVFLDKTVRDEINKMLWESTVDYLINTSNLLSVN